MKGDPTGAPFELATGPWFWLRPGPAGTGWSKILAIQAIDSPL